MDKFRDLEPRTDVKGGSPKTPSRIPITEFNEGVAAPHPHGLFGFNGQFWPLITRIIFVVLQVAVFAAFFWAKSNFVTKEEYERDSREALKSMHSIDMSMQRIVDKLDGYDHVAKKQEEMDAAIHALEKEIWETKNKGRP